MILTGVLTGQEPVMYIKKTSTKSAQRKNVTYVKIFGYVEALCR